MTPTHNPAQVNNKNDSTITIHSASLGVGLAVGFLAAVIAMSIILLLVVLIARQRGRQRWGTPANYEGNHSSVLLHTLLIYSILTILSQSPQ